MQQEGNDMEQGHADTLTKPWIAGAIGAVVTLLGVLILRIIQQPLQPYGTAKVPFVQHGIRLRALARIQEMDTFSPFEAYRIMDGDYAVGGKIVAMLWGAVFGHDVGSVLLVGLIWMCLLALCFGATARALGASQWAALTASLFVMMLPCVHGAATIYYYDLPATALVWASVLVALRHRKGSPWKAGVVVGLAFSAACLTKWAALPFGLPLVAGALLCGAGSDRRAAGIRLLTCVPVLALVLACALCVDNESLMGNFSSQQAPVPDAGNPLGLRGKIVDVPERLVYAVVQFVTAVLSPLLAALLLPLAFLWGWRDRRGLPLILLGAAGTLTFTLLVAADADERFLAPAGLTLTLAAVLALDRLRSTQRAGVLAGVFMVLGLLVAWDFHHANRSPWNHEVVFFSIGQDGPSARLRGLGAVSSVEALGWNRRDETPNVPEKLLAATWDVFDKEPETDVLVTAGAEAAGVHSVWFEYEHLRAYLAGEKNLLSNYPKSADPCPVDPEGGSTTLLLTPDEDFPGCLEEGLWTLDKRLSGENLELLLYRRKPPQRPIPQPSTGYAEPGAGDQLLFK